MSGIAISYRRLDAEGSAGRLFDRLCARYGPDFVFMDHEAIQTGQDWQAIIDERMTTSDVVLVVIGPRWADASDIRGRRRLDEERDPVRSEIRTALRHGVRVLPVLVESAPTTAISDVPVDIAEIQTVQAVTIDSRFYDRDVDGLFGLIDQAIGFGDHVPDLDNRATAVAALLGVTESGPVGKPILVTSWTGFTSTFGEFAPDSYLPHAVYGWFGNGGTACYVVRTEPGLESLESALQGLESMPDVTIVAAPDLVGQHEDGTLTLDELRTGHLTLANHAESLGARLAILDIPVGASWQEALDYREHLGINSGHAVIYHPWLEVFDPAIQRPRAVPSCGHLAGSWARSDLQKGVWTPPAGLPLQNVLQLDRRIAPSLTGQSLAAVKGINPIEALPREGILTRESVTLAESGSPFRQIHWTRLLHEVGKLLIEATAWAGFETSNRATWLRMTSNAEFVLERLWERGALPGETAPDAYRVRCDEEVNRALALSGRIQLDAGVAVAIDSFRWIRIEQPARTCSFIEGVPWG